MREKVIKDILISIIVPIYNIKEEYLRKCIESLTRQTILNEIEIILVDDGSTNSDLMICKEYEKIYSNITVINIKNSGVSVARNIGIQKARRKWISFVDSDDYVEKNMFEVMKNLLNNDDTIDILIASSYSNYEKIEVKNSFYDKQGALDELDKEELLLEIIGFGKKKGYPKEASVAVPWAKLYRTSFLKENEIMFVKGLIKSQDAIFNLYAIENASKIVYYEKCVYHYRKIETSITNRYTKNIIKYCEDFISQAQKYIMKYNKNDDFKHALEIRKIKSISKYMENYFFNKNNNLKYSDKKRQVINILNSRLYKNSIKTAKYNEVTGYLKLMLFCMKIQNVLGIKLLVDLKQFIKNVSKKMNK